MCRSDLTNSLNADVENVTNYSLVCWHLAKMWNTINTLCLLQDFKTDDHYGTQSPKSILRLTTSAKREYDELLKIIQEVTPEVTLQQMKCVLRDFNGNYN